MRSYAIVWVTRAPSQYPKRRLSVRSRKVSKPRDWYFKLSYRFEIWQAHRQQPCRSACQISERSDNSKYKSRGFETLRDLTERRLFGYWDGAQMVILCLKPVNGPGRALCRPSVDIVVVAPSLVQNGPSQLRTAAHTREFKCTHGQQCA